MLRIIVLPAAEPDRVELTFPFDRDVLNAVKRMPGREYDRVRRRWSIPRRSVPRLGAVLTGRDVRIIDRVRVPGQ